MWTDISGNLPADSTSYIDSGLSADTCYGYRVVAINVDGEAISTAVVVATDTAGGGNRIGGTGAIRRSPVGR